MQWNTNENQLECANHLGYTEWKEIYLVLISNYLWYIIKFRHEKPMYWLMVNSTTRAKLCVFFKYQIYIDRWYICKYKHNLRVYGKKTS